MNAISHSPPTPQRRLVIVEDEAILALDIQRYLSNAGYDVRGVAADADAALSLVEHERPDLVLMDIRLQGSRDGIETAAALRSQFDVPVVYLTAHGDANTIERAQRTEPLGYLLKPFKKPDLQNVVSIALARNDSERQLRRREEALSTTLSCIGEAIVTTDQAGSVTYLNPAAEVLLGQPSRQVLSRPLEDVLPLRAGEGGAIEDPVREAQHHGRVQFDSVFSRPDGLHTMAGTAAELRQGQSSFGVVLALRDLTELLQTRRQLEFAERLASLGTLAAGVAHEVNNPLSVVVAALEFALANGALSFELKDALTDASEAAQRVARIISELRTFAYPQTEKLRPGDPREAIGSALKLTRSYWRRVAGVELDLQPVPAVFSAPFRLSQVLVNLIVNAVQAMHQLTDRSHLLSFASFTDAQGRAVLSLTDTGPGIDAALRERIFEPFFTTKPNGKGTGLGLSVSRSIVESHGGHIAVTAGPDALGARFSIVLPATQVDQRPAPPRVLWVGERTPECDALVLEADCRVVTGAETDLRELVAAFRPEVVLLNVPHLRSRLLTATLPEFETSALSVGAFAAPGVLCLRTPFDARALAALCRRSSARDG